MKRPSAQAEDGNGHRLVLQALEGAGNVSQRSLADAVGLAASQVNRIIRALVAQGRLQVANDSVRPYAYRVTPDGLRYLRALTYERYEMAVDDFRRVQESIRRCFAKLRSEGVRRVVFYGAGDIMDVALPLAQDVGLRVEGVIDDDPCKHGGMRGVLTVWSPEKLTEVAPDAVVITSFRHADRIRQRLDGGASTGFRVAQL
jgi:DNA-binding MarR family transcriptional regulator